MMEMYMCYIYQTDQVSGNSICHGTSYSPVGRSILTLEWNMLLMLWAVLFFLIIKKNFLSWLA